MQKLKENKGITLIALIITIIIMLILVGVTISVSLNGGLFSTAKEATKETQIAQEKEELLMAALGALNQNGKVDLGKLDNNLPEGFQKVGEGTYKNIETENIFIVGTDGSISLVETWSETIPDGGTYYVGVTSTKTGDYTGATETLTTGDKFPETVNAGDVYVFGDYEYRYNYDYVVMLGGAWEKTDYAGWGVRVLDDTKETYDPILEYINSTPIKSISCAYYYCKNLTIAPALPNTAENLFRLFLGCTSLTDISNVQIPSNAKNLQNAFGNCKLLTDASHLIIPSSVTDMTWTFNSCENLIVGPDMTQATGVDQMYMTFTECTNLKSAPDLSNCVNLTNITGTFYECTSLSGTITFNSPYYKNINGCFAGVDMSNITLTGSSTQLAEIGATGTNYQS